MKKLFYIIITSTLTSCGATDPDSRWTANDKETAYKNCISTPRPDLTDEQKNKVCDCYVEKLKAASPDPLQQDKITTEQSIKLIKECAALIKK